MGRVDSHIPTGNRSAFVRGRASSSLAAQLLSGVHVHADCICTIKQDYGDSEGESDDEEEQPGSKRARKSAGKAPKFGPIVLHAADLPLIDSLLLHF